LVTETTFAIAPAFAFGKEADFNKVEVASYLSTNLSEGTAAEALLYAKGGVEAKVVSLTMNLL